MSTYRTLLIRALIITGLAPEPLVQHALKLALLLALFLEFDVGWRK